MGMREYSFEELAVGTKESFAKEITENDMRSFESISGDSNPLHTDDSYASSKGFKGKVVYGMLSGSLLSRLAGMYLPGKRSLLLSASIDFMKPCYVGDTLTVEGVVADKKDFGKLIKVSFSMTAQKGVKISKGSILVKVQE